MAKSVESISIIRSIEGYVLQLEDEDGKAREFILSFDQLEIMAEEIERHLLDGDDPLDAEDDDPAEE